MKSFVLAVAILLTANAFADDDPDIDEIASRVDVAASAGNGVKSSTDVTGRYLGSDRNFTTYRLREITGDKADCQAQLWREADEGNTRPTTLASGAAWKFKGIDSKRGQVAELIFHIERGGKIVGQVFMRCAPDPDDDETTLDVLNHQVAKSLELFGVKEKFEIKLRPSRRERRGEAPARRGTASEEATVKTPKKSSKK